MRESEACPKTGLRRATGLQDAVRYNVLMIRQRHAVFAFALACAGSVGAAETAAVAAVLEDVKTRIAAREFADAEGRAEALIIAVEAELGRYAPALSEPLTLLGDARMRLDDHAGALEAFNRAKHIVRIGDGVQGLAQLPLLYREAAALAALGDRGAANDRHEFAYSLKARTYGEEDPRLIPGLLQLIDWYRYNYKHRAAQVLYETVIATAKANYPPDDVRIIEALRGYAATYRERRFGVRAPGRGGFRAWPPGYPPDPPWYQKSTFIRGKKALSEVLERSERADGVTDAEIAAAVLDLGDWHLLHYEYGIAMSHYRRTWRLLEKYPELRRRTFENPTPLYLRLPMDPAHHVDGGESRSGRTMDGVVQLALTITHRGDVVGRRTLRAEPRNLMEFRVRRAAKLARYRPAFRDGNPVPRRDFKLQFNYKYYAGMALR